MADQDLAADGSVILSRDGLDGVIGALKTQGFRTVGPRVAEGAVVYGDLDGVDDLPEGLGDEQQGGHYRLRPRGDDRLFGHTIAPQGWKRFLFPPRHKLFGARRDGHGFEIEPPPPPDAPLALIGARACELAAIALQARVFGDKDFSDPGYQGRLAGAFVVAVECAEAGGTCFCCSMGSGPAVDRGFDIRLVELPGQRFLAVAGSERGARVLEPAVDDAATESDFAAARAQREAVRAAMGRKMDTDTAAALIEHTEHPRWDDVASRCLTCGNCTMVCPTCFCTTVEDVTDLTGDHAERWRVWDSCFSIDYSHVAGGALRTSARARYRQWITHKLSTWFGQFGTSGCVGCGRCITWCPVGIDITAEVNAIKNS